MEFKVESTGNEEESVTPQDFGLNPIVASALRDLKDIDNFGLRLPKEEIKEEDEYIVPEIKIEDTHLIPESSAFEESPKKRQRRKPNKYSDLINALGSPKRNKKIENGKPESKKGRKKKSDSQGSSCEQIKVEPKFEIDVFENHEVIRARCSVCKDDVQRTALELKQHFKANHPGKRCRFPKFICETSPSCDICGKVFKTAPILRDHMETHNNYFFCVEDNHSTKKLLDHVIHLVVHSEDSIFRCTLCDFFTADITNIKDHLQNHEKSTKYWCEACKKSFPILSHFQEHDNFHTGLKPFNCEFCEKTFMYSRHLHAHKVAMHKEELTGVNVNQCPICLKEYRHRNSLKLHMNAHTGNFAICDVCGKTLCSKEKLKFHMRIHTGYKPYCCPHCGKCFTKKPILVEHIRVHTGERPYSCDYCTKTFSQRSSLVIHMRGHTGDKPYVCAFCSKAYAAKAMLTFHLKSCQGFANMSYLNL